MIPYCVSVIDEHAEMYPIVGCMQTLWGQRVGDVKGLQILSPRKDPGPLAQTRLGQHTVLQRVELNAFRREKHFPVGHGSHRDP